MGVGNFFITGAETAYVDHDLVRDCEDEFDDFGFDDLVANIISILPKTFEPTTKKTHHDDGGLLIAESGFYDVTVVDWETYYAVNVIPKEAYWSEPWDVNPLAVYHLPRVSASIFDKLHEMYPLRIRCCAWTSGQYVPTNAQAA